MNVLLLAGLLLVKTPLKIEIIHTSNIIGNFGKSKATWINPDFPPTLGGYESLAELLERESTKCKKEGTLLLLLDSGNFTGGYVTGENLVIDSLAFYMNSLKYDFINLGVRELTVFPAGERKNKFLPQPLILKDYLKKFNTTFISSNVDFSDPEYKNLVKKYAIIEYKGVKIGIFGMVSENAPQFLYQDIDPEAKATIKPELSSPCGVETQIIKEEEPFDLKIGREYQTAKLMVDTLKALGCDIIIMLSSIGYYRERFLANDVPGIDVILGGFDGFGTRTAYVNPINHTIILRNYDYLSQVGKLVLRVDPKAKTITGFDYTAITLFEEEFTPIAPAEEEGEE